MGGQLETRCLEGTGEEVAFDFWGRISAVGPRVPKGGE
jgi:hypothetical protein